MLTLFSASYCRPLFEPFVITRRIQRINKQMPIQSREPQLDSSIGIRAPLKTLSFEQATEGTIKVASGARTRAVCEAATPSVKLK